jgi:hypothetical protein
MKSFNIQVMTNMLHANHGLGIIQIIKFLIITGDNSGQQWV